MQVDPLDEAIKWLEKANANLEPQLLNAAAKREQLVSYARVKKLASFGETQLAGYVEDPMELARVSGTSIGQAKTTVETAKALRHADDVSQAFAGGEVSLEQANELTKEMSLPPKAAETASASRNAWAVSTVAFALPIEVPDTRASSIGSST